MSLKAKLEAVIYAAEEPVTLTQLAQLFAADALEWQAAQAAAAAEATAEFAGEPPAAAETMPLIENGMASLGMADTVAMSIQAGQQAAEAVLANDVSADGDALSSEATAEAEAPGPEEAQTGEESEGADTAEAAAAADEAPEPGEPVDAEAEARRLARQRDREIKSILRQILDEIIATYEHDDRGIEVREIAGGYRMATKPECHDAVRLFVKSLKPPMKLSLPALETLAVVAYKQPVTAPEVSEIRGVESGGVLGSLLARKLIATAGRKQVIGRPILYKTTREFLLRFGLKDLAELPSMEEFEKMAAEIEEMEPEAVAADAAETAAEEAADIAHAAEDSAELEANSPSGAELAEAAEAQAAIEAAEAEQATAADSESASAEPASSEPVSSEPASEEQPASAETPTDAMSAEPPPSSNEQDAQHIEPSDAPPAEPEPSAPAENEAIPDAQKVEEEH